MARVNLLLQGGNYRRSITLKSAATIAIMDMAMLQRNDAPYSML